MTKGCAGVCVCVCVQSLTLVAGVNISVPEEQVMGLGVCLGVCLGVSLAGGRQPRGVLR